MPDMMPLSAISVMDVEAQWLEGTSVNFTEAAKAVVESISDRQGDAQSTGGKTTSFHFKSIPFCYML